MDTEQTLLEAALWEAKGASAVRRADWSPTPRRVHTRGRPLEVHLVLCAHHKRGSVPFGVCHFPEVCRRSTLEVSACPGGKSKQVSGWMLLPGRSVLVPAGAFLGRCELETKSVALGYPVRICQSLCRKQGMTLYPLEREPSEVVL